MSLDYFTQAYIEALFFTEQEQLDEDASLNHGDALGVSVDDLAPETLKRIVEDCANFQLLNKVALNSVMRSPSYDETDQGYGLRNAGHDFWLSRNGHGTGFWDRNLGKAGELLTNAANAFKELNPYLGDDGQVYLG